MREFWRSRYTLMQAHWEWPQWFNYFYCIVEVFLLFLGFFFHTFGWVRVLGVSFAGFPPSFLLYVGLFFGVGIIFATFHPGFGGLPLTLVNSAWRIWDNFGPYAALGVFFWGGIFIYALGRSLWPLLGPATMRQIARLKPFFKKVQTRYGRSKLSAILTE